MFSLQQNRRIKGWNRFCPEAEAGGYGGRWPKQTVYIHVSKCKNDKIKKINYIYFYIQ
jgi:hypothetical protein